MNNSSSKKTMFLSTKIKLNIPRIQHSHSPHQPHALTCGDKKKY